MHKIFTLVLICFIVLIKPLTVAAQVDVQDSLALVALYNSTDGQNWIHHDGWLSAPVHTWFGIEIDDNNRVDKINLPQNNLKGSLPASLGNLAALTTLELSDNEIMGAIPGSINNLNQLTFFRLIRNRFNYDQFENLPLDIVIKGYFGYWHNISLLRAFFDQHKIHIHRKGNMFSVTAGGTLSNNEYRWKRNGVLDTTIYGDSTFKLKEPGIYTVIVVNKNVRVNIRGLILRSVRDTVIAVRDEGRLATSDETKQLIVYPNPAKGTMNIRLPKATANSYVLLYSMDGKQILKQPVTSSQLHINVSSIATGNYELLLLEENKIKYKHPIIIVR